MYAASHITTKRSAATQTGAQFTLGAWDLPQISALFLSRILVRFKHF
jgi:hypothetical protein